MPITVIALHAALAVASALPAQTTLPVVFTATVSAKSAHAGQQVAARTTAPVRLTNGLVIAKGARISGHVVQATAFRFDSTPYAKQQAATLAIQFDSVEDRGTALPLHASVRALASPVTSWATQDPQATDIDPTHTTTRVGGDQVTPFEKAVLSSDDTIVGYQHGGYVYAHLLSNGDCDASDTEQAMGIFSASACGLYGMSTDTLSTQSGTNGPVVVLSSTRHSAEIHKNSEALLEEVSE